MWNYTAGRKVEFGAWWESKNGSFFLENAKWVLSSSGEFCSLAPLWADRLAPGYQTRLHDARLPSALTNLKPNSYSKMADFGTDFGRTKNEKTYFDQNPFLASFSRFHDHFLLIEGFGSEITSHALKFGPKGWNLVWRKK